MGRSCPAVQAATPFDTLRTSNSGERLAALSLNLQIHLLTADTRGQGAAMAAALHSSFSILHSSLSLHRLTPGDEAAQKRAFVESLGAERVAAVGNGANLWRNSAAMRRCWPWRPWGSLPVAPFDIAQDKQQCRVGAGGAGPGRLAKLRPDRARHRRGAGPAVAPPTADSHPPAPRALLSPLNSPCPL